MYVVRTNSVHHKQAKVHLSDCHVVNGLISTGTPIVRASTIDEALRTPGANDICAYCAVRIGGRLGATTGKDSAQENASQDPSAAPSYLAKKRASLRPVRKSN